MSPSRARRAWSEAVVRPAKTMVLRAAADAGAVLGLVEKQAKAARVQLDQGNWPQADEQLRSARKGVHAAQETLRTAQRWVGGLDSAD